MDMGEVEDHEDYADDEPYRPARTVVKHMLEIVFDFLNYGYTDPATLAAREMELGLQRNFADFDCGISEDYATIYLEAWSVDRIIVNREMFLIPIGSGQEARVNETYNKQNFTWGEVDALAEYHAAPHNLHNGLEIDALNFCWLGDMQRSHAIWGRHHRTWLRMRWRRRIRRFFGWG